MTSAIELQIISKILTSDDEALVNDLCAYDSSYYAVFKPHIEFILNHRNRFGNVPDVFTFAAEFPDVTLVEVSRESKEFLVEGIKKNKQQILLLNTFNTLKDLGSGDVTQAWEYLNNQCAIASQLSNVQPMDIIQEASARSQQVIEWSKQTRIPTGFAELDKLTYGGWSTVEELVVFVGRSNAGKSWCATRMMEAAQKAGFPVAYYSPEMQSAYLATRFDTWRGHYQNSKLFRGTYDENYLKYIQSLPEDPTSAFIIEDKDMPDGVSPAHLEPFIKKHGIKLLIIDGISYMVDDRNGRNDHDKFGNICHDLFQLSKRYGCAVAVMVQANRETKESKDDKGIPFPTLYNIAGSDAIGQIATQVYAIRQIFDKHVFEFRLEKSRMAVNENNTLSYSWDVNTGNMQYLQGEQGEDPMLDMPKSTDILPNPTGPDNSGLDLDLTDGEDNVEF